MAMSFNFILSNNNSANGYLTASETEESSLLTESNIQNSSNILTASTASNEACIDAFGGKDIFGTCDVSNMNETVFANASVETAGSIASNSVETMGSVACGAAETAGSVAYGSSDSGSSGSAGFSSFC